MKRNSNCQRRKRYSSATIKITHFRNKSVDSLDFLTFYFLYFSLWLEFAEPSEASQIPKSQFQLSSVAHITFAELCAKYWKICERWPQNLSSTDWSSLIIVWLEINVAWWLSFYHLIKYSSNLMSFPIKYFPLTLSSVVNETLFFLLYLKSYDTVIGQAKWNCGWICSTNQLKYLFLEIFEKMSTKAGQI